MIFLSLSTGFQWVLCEMQRSLIQDPVSVVLERHKMSWLYSRAEWCFQESLKLNLENYLTFRVCLAEKLSPLRKLLLPVASVTWNTGFNWIYKIFGNEKILKYSTSQGSVSLLSNFFFLSSFVSMQLID